MGGLVFTMGGWVLLGVVVCLLMLASYWRLFEKMGREGYLSLIPLYNLYVLFEEVSGKGKRMFNLLAPVFAHIILLIVAEVFEPEYDTLEILAIILYAIGAIISLVTMIKYKLALARMFGHKTSFGVGLLFFEGIFVFLIAFSSDACVFYDRDNVAHDLTVKSDNAVSRLIDKLDSWMRSDASAKKEIQEAALLKGLTELNGKGIIDDELYKAKKKEILERLSADSEEAYGKKPISDERKELYRETTSYKEERKRSKRSETVENAWTCAYCGKHNIGNGSVCGQCGKIK